MPAFASFRLRAAFRMAVLAAGIGLGTAEAENTPPGFPPLSKSDFKPATLGPHEPQIKVEFPGAAASRGVPKGSATLSVLIDADGRALDFLVTRYTDRAFGVALLEEARTLEFQPAVLSNLTVPSRLDIAYVFEANLAMNVLEASRILNSGGKPRTVYAAVSERKLDEPLELTSAVLPALPEDFPAPADGSPVRVYVTFFVDEEGRARVPNVESASSPLLIPHAIRVVLKWQFTPPTVNGKPALAFAGRPVRFLEQPAVERTDKGGRKRGTGR